MMSPALVLRLRRNGILMPRTAIATSDLTGLELAVVLAVLRMETGGGRNIYGHDPVRNPIKSPAGGSLAVTRSNYFSYKHYRILGYGMQGVGPMQLTWYSYQDLADKYGGCYNIGPNMRVAAEHLKASINKYGLWGGLRSYNGAGPAATTYANVAVGYVQHYRWVLKGAKLSNLAASEFSADLPPIMNAETTTASENSLDLTYAPFDFLTSEKVDLRQTNWRGH